MPKKINKVFLKSISLGAVIGIAGAGIGIGTYYIFSSTTHNSPKYKLGKALEVNIHGVLVKEFPTNYHSNGKYNDNDYLYSKEILKKMGEYFYNEQYRGPEWSVLNGIVLGDKNTISSEENGLYVPGENVIHLNISSLEESKTDAHYGIDTEMKYNNPKQPFYEWSMQSLFQIFAHEYGHHLANIYLNNIKNDTVEENEIFQLKHENDEYNYWSKDFENSFRKILYGFDSNTQLQHQKSVYPKTVETNGKVYKKPLVQLYTAKTFYDYANNPNSKEKFLDLNKTFTEKNSKNSIYESGGFSASGDRVKFINNIKYIYNLDELFTRHLEQLCLKMPITSTSKKSNKPGWGILSEGKNGDKSISPYLQDTLRSYDLTIANGKWDINSTFGDGVYADDQFYSRKITKKQATSNKQQATKKQIIKTTRADNLYNLYKKGMHIGQPISYITLDEFDNGWRPDSISIGGYLQSDKYKKIRMYDLTNPGKTITEDLKTSESNWGYKYFWNAKDWKQDIQMTIYNNKFNLKDMEHDVLNIQIKKDDNNDGKIDNKDKWETIQMNKEQVKGISSYKQTLDNKNNFWHVKKITNNKNIKEDVIVSKF